MTALHAGAFFRLAFFQPPSLRLTVALSHASLEGHAQTFASSLLTGPTRVACPVAVDPCPVATPSQLLTCCLCVFLSLRSLSPGCSHFRFAAASRQNPAAPEPVTSDACKPIDITGPKWQGGQLGVYAYAYVNEHVACGSDRATGRCAGSVRGRSACV